MNDKFIDSVFVKMTEYEDSPLRINHFLKVWGYARFIGRKQGLDERTQLILETAALMHDIGIKPALKTYGSSDGKYQEQLGVEPARAMLKDLTDDQELTERVCFLIAHHHTYTNVEGIDYRILLEADFLVNAFEDGLSQKAVETASEKIFETDEGKRILRETYNI